MNTLMNDIDLNQIQASMSRAYYDWYWMRVGNRLAGLAERVMKILEYRRLRNWLAGARNEVNPRGNTVYRNVCADRRLGFRGYVRLDYDLELATWRPFATTRDKDAFGIWVDSKARRILNYCEGERILVVCSTAASFRAELAQMNADYGEAPPAFEVIHPDGDIERVYDPRPDGSEATDDPVSL